MYRTIIVVGLGGMAGSAARYLATDLLTKAFPTALPVGTLAVNVLGCLLIGLVYGVSERTGWLSPELRVTLAAGFCGGFTTFSAFAYENIVLLQQKNYMLFAAYASLSFVLCLAATLAGLAIARP